MRETTQVDERSLLDAVQRDVEVLLRRGLTSESDRDLIPLWSAAASRGWKDLVDASGRVKADRLRNFRRDEILVQDLPGAPISSSRLGNQLVGWRRATFNCLRQCFDILVAAGYEGLLHKYPCHRAGNPHVLRYRGYEFTFSWARHIYCLGLMNRSLGPKLQDESIVLEFGGSYGALASLVRQEYPGWHYVSVDLPEQLIIARYFLGCSFPGARIAGPRELMDVPVITRDFIKDFDFVLVPAGMFQRLAPGAIDVVTSFGSLGEMSRQYFDAYVLSDVYRSARYQFMINRIGARPAAYHNDITALDYPIWNRDQMLHFDVCPIYAVDFLFNSSFFSYESAVPDPHFEYIGRVSA